MEDFSRKSKTNAQESPRRMNTKPVLQVLRKGATCVPLSQCSRLEPTFTLVDRPLDQSHPCIPPCTDTFTVIIGNQLVIGTRERNEEGC